MYLPSGLYSGPSSSPGVLVKRSSGPPPDGMRYTSYSLFRSPQKTIYLPSGDHPCMYEGPIGVICLASPPPTGTVKPTDAPCSPLPLLTASILPSNEITWSLLFLLASTVLIAVGVLVARLKLYRIPSRL